MQKSGNWQFPAICAHEKRRHKPTSLTFPSIYLRENRQLRLEPTTKKTYKYIQSTFKRNRIYGDKAATKRTATKRSYIIIPTDKNYLAEVSKNNVIILTVGDESGILYWFPIYSDIDITIIHGRVVQGWRWVGGHHWSQKCGGLYCTTIFRIFVKRFGSFHKQWRVVISDLRNMADYQE